MKKAILVLIAGLVLIYFVALVPNNAEAKPDWSKCSGDKTVDYIPLFCYGMDNKLIPKSEREKNLTDSEGYPPQSIHYDDFTVVSDKKTLDKYLK